MTIALLTQLTTDLEVLRADTEELAAILKHLHTS
jgi:hypothetical protein